MQIINGDCLEVLRGMPANSIDAICTDPPYGLSNTSPDQVTKAIVKWASGDREFVPAGRGFMGAEWDGFVPPPAVWDECYRVLKPGGHMAVFAGTRTQDLMGLSIRLAGFDIRDSVAWLYGSGFPKSQDVGKAIDKAGHKSEARAREFTEWMRSTGITARQVNEATGTNMGSHYLTDKSQPAVAVADLFDKLRPYLPDVPERIERLVAERTGVSWVDYKSRIVGEKPAFGIGGNGILGGHADGATMKIVGDATTREAQRWSGWGTALKPAHEPIILARKPFKGTVASNVVEWGTGAINIDACRIPSTDKAKFPACVVSATENVFDGGKGMYGAKPRGEDTNPQGRFPANVALDPVAADALDQQSGTLKSGARSHYPGEKLNDAWREMEGRSDRATFTSESHYSADSGGASRFFHVAEPDAPFLYAAKAPKKERPVIYPNPVLRLREGLTPEQEDHVRARLQDAGVELH